MNELAILAYTTAGGILGAGLTHHVTHLADRRTARALVIERLAKVEETYARLRSPMPEDEPDSQPRIDRELALLVSAALIAGVPRAPMRLYLAACRHDEHARRTRTETGLFSDRLARQLTANMDKLKTNTNLADIQKRLHSIVNSTEEINKQTTVIEDAASRLRHAALEMLSLGLWHPLAAQLRRRKLRTLRKAAENLEATVRGHAAALSRMEALAAQADRGIAGM